jgi:hypothetical protein
MYSVLLLFVLCLTKKYHTHTHTVIPEKNTGKKGVIPEKKEQEQERKREWGEGGVGGAPAE